MTRAARVSWPPPSCLATESQPGLTLFCVALFGVRRSLLCGLLQWDGVTAISPGFDSYGSLLASRILLGVSEGPLFSLASSYIKAHFEDRENGKPNAFVNMDTGLGLAIGFSLSSLMLVHFQWQTSFYLLGLMNVGLGIRSFSPLPA